MFDFCQFFKKINKPKYQNKILKDRWLTERDTEKRDVTEGGKRRRRKKKLKPKKIFWRRSLRVCVWNVNFSLNLTFCVSLFLSVEVWILPPLYNSPAHWFYPVNHTGNLSLNSVYFLIAVIICSRGPRSSLRDVRLNQ